MVQHNLFVLESTFLTHTLKAETIGAVCILCIIVFSSLFSLAEGVNSINIFPPPPDSKPYGLSYEEHVKNFYKWLISMPADENPVTDITGQKCANGQTNSNSSVFYLVGTGGGFSHKTCKVPTGKAIFIPVGSAIMSNKESPNASIDDLHKLARNDQDSITSLSLKIDDKEYSKKDLEKYRIHTEDFELVFPKNGIFGGTEGKSKVVADGYHVITEKLPKGTYTIDYEGTIFCKPGLECVQTFFAEHVIFTLIVE